MTRSTFLLINAAIGLLFGLGLLFFPQYFMSTFGPALSPTATLLARDIGAFLLGFGLLNGFSSKADYSRSLGAVLAANLAVQCVTFVLDLRSVLGGVVDQHGWGPVMQHAVLGFGFAFYWLQARRLASMQSV
ncbi:hypothetical protein [Burkholderia sp. PAMC 26561]|uniref:hypothetical protein n=1 Tax=Burkholderia sp. PAMC 26561 TaxID=1795043 RepID=UPI000782617F|nr:hypothetical protein [Burkholderia sp. PAMC 26561]